MEEPKRQKPYAKPQGERRGLLLVYTGDGKGKSTAAFGLALRAHGRGLKVRIFQFVKHGTARFGEHRAFALLGIPIEGLGDGFTWRSRDLARSAALAQEGWGRAKEVLLSGTYDLVVLDEATYPLRYGWVSLEEFLEVLRARPPHVHVVVTGRGEDSSKSNLREVLDLPALLLVLGDGVDEIRIPGERVGSSFDWVGTRHDGTEVLIEIKAVDYIVHRDSWTEDEAPAHIEVQVQHQLEVADRWDTALIVAFTGIHTWHVIERQRDRETGAAIREAAAEFWAMVDEGREPAPDFGRDADIIALLHRNSGDDLEDMTDDTDMDNLLTRYDVAQQIKRDAEASAKAISAVANRYKASTWVCFEIRVAI